MTGTIELFSFGYGFLDDDSQVPEAEHVENVCNSLRNPMDRERLRVLSGEDEEVQAHVLNTPGAREFIERQVIFLQGLHHDQPRRLAIGCVAGRHRSVALVILIGQILEAYGYIVHITHIHLEQAMNNEPLRRRLR